MLRADGVSPLVAASVGGHLRIVDLLLDAGADPNLTTLEGWYAHHFAKNAGHMEVAERLLRAHAGKAPAFDYAKQWLDRADPRQLSIYEKLYDDVTLEKRRFFNIGSGHWRHKYWTNVDYASDYYNYESNLIDVPWDISLLQPLLVESGSAELAFCSHTVEHLTDEQNRNMFREARRILNTGGVFRITCPNIEQYYQAYARRDMYISGHHGYNIPFDEMETKAGFSKAEFSQWFVYEIATQLVTSIDGHKPRYDRDYAGLDRIFQTMPVEEALDYLCGQIDYDLQRKLPGTHINWWTADKVCRELRAAGFSATVVSVPGGSVAPVMRDRAYFDTVSPTFSLFVEGIA